MCKETAPSAAARVGFSSTTNNGGESDVPMRAVPAPWRRGGVLSIPTGRNGNGGDAR